jgi:hypothetical protein
MAVSTSSSTSGSAGLELEDFPKPERRPAVAEAFAQ